MGSLTIDKANLVIGTSNVTKTYDGTTSALGSAIATAGTQLFGTDSLSGGSFAFTNKNAGTGKTVTVSGVTLNDGNSGNNYYVSYADNTSSTINKANLILTTGNVVKTYDGSTSALGSAVATSGTQVFAGDNISGGTFAFTNKHAGSGKTVTTSGVTVNDGNSGNNYNVTYADNSTSTINQASLVISSTDASKTYDGTTSATATAVVNSGTLFDTDSLSGGAFTYDSKHAGTGKSVSVSGVTVNDGNGGNNYAVTYADNTNSSISKANLVISSVDASKTYDGTTTANGSAAAAAGTQVFSGDSLTGGIFSYDTKHAGSGKTVSVSGVSVNDGNNGDNYTVSYVDNTNSSINKANLVITTADVTKTYDGTTSALGSAEATSGTEVFADDSLSGGTFSFDTRNAGTGKTVTVSAVTVNDGNSGNNYNVIYSDNVNSSIDKANLVISTSDVTKTYDGTTAASGTAVASNGTEVFAGDSLSGGTFTFDTRHAGTGKTVSVSSVSVNDGNSGNNYNVSYADNSNSSIDKASLVISTTNVNKTYDGTTAASGTAVASNGTEVFAGDSLSGGTFTFDTRHAGTGKTVSVFSVSVDDGNSGNNYNVSYADNTDSSINKANLVITSTNAHKVYNGTTAASATAVVTSGTELFAGDSISGGTFSFENKNAGTGKSVSVSGVSISDGNSGNNYNVIYQDNVSSAIDKALMTIQAVAETKVYDGRLASSMRPLTIGRVRGDSISGLRQEFSDKNAGTGKTINVVSGFVINDGNGGNNYTVNVVSSHAGVITPKQLILQAVANSKAYDGGITSINKPTVIGLVQGDRVTGLFQQYTDKQIGTNKTLVVKGGYVVDDGNGGNNYSTSEQSNNQGEIF
jgi:galactitol-specific phosphotransferase system IIB component